MDLPAVWSQQWTALGRSALEKGKSACGTHLPDLEQPRPPDVPSGLAKLRLVKNEGRVSSHQLGDFEDEHNALK